MGLLKKTKLMYQLGFLSFVLLMFTVTISGFTITKLSSIGTEIEDIAELDMPLTEVATSVTTHQLEQAVALEKALRFGQVMAAAETAHEHYEEARKAFETNTRLVDEELAKGEKLAEEAALNAHTEDAKKEFEHVLSVLKTIEAEHADFEHQGEELFKMIENGQLTEAAQLAVKLEAEEEHLDHALEELLKELETFTENALSTAEQDEQAALITTMILAAIALVAGVFLAWLIGRSITGPLLQMTSTMGILSDGNLEIEIPAQDYTNEVGEMAHAVQGFKENAIRVRNMEQEQIEAKRRAEAQRKAALTHMANTFEESVAEVVGIVSSSSTELEASAGQMTNTAENTSKLAVTVAAAAEEASTNVQTVASAAEELSSSISEISRQVAQSTQISGTAVVEVDNANEKVQGLAEAANKIGEVVALITDIADQTNLLALNATIEAARAGEAGKGFAVVASEVKNLANQTAKATEEISSQIGGIQGATQEAVAAIGSIGGIINQMNEISSTIAAAVEEQGAATQEIARNVEQASTGTTEVSSNIQQVKMASEDSTSAAREITSAAGQLSMQSETLRKEVTHFLTEIRADNDQAQLYRWDDDIATGIDKIDREHKECMDDMNTYHSLMLSGEGESGLDDIIRRLQQHIEHHFRDEEEYMSSIGYPGLADHKREHDEFRTRVEQLKAGMEHSGHSTDADTEFYNYVSHWMNNHFRRADKEYVAYARTQRQAAE